MRLPDFISENIEPILAEWETFARSLEPGKKMTKLALRNDAEAILLATVRDMRVSQSLSQQSSKSQGHGGIGGTESDGLDDASHLHGVARAGSAFDIIEVVSEYRALRASVLALWRRSLPDPDLHDIDDITRFNESMDQSLGKAVGSYTTHVDQARRMFLAILGHDLRGPLSCINMAAHVISRAHPQLTTDESLRIIRSNALETMKLIKDLIDFASTGLGSAMPLTCKTVDLEIICREVVDTCSINHPGRKLNFEITGKCTGDWDADRLRQVVSNLMGNAIQHGSVDGAVDLSVTCDQSTATMSVRNQGEPIPPDLLPTIFNPMVRGTSPETDTRRAPGSVGLGLYIVRAIVAAHGGAIEVSSTAQEGTTFTVRLPREREAT